MQILKWFYIITVGFILIGGVYYISNNQFDLYQLWAVSAYLVGLYLIRGK